jgi:pyruvate/2-oxoglutarate dehydrogenase complex dihydrolipoamide acyltransferase (E2) component
MSDTTEIRMPAPAAGVREATLAVWLKRAGEAVAAGDVIAEALTDKANVEIPAPASGVLEAILVEEGAVVPVGTPIARLRTEGQRP